MTASMAWMGVDNDEEAPPPTLNVKGGASSSCPIGFPSDQIPADDPYGRDGDGDSRARDHGDEACRTTGAGRWLVNTDGAGRFAPLHVATGLGYAALDGTVVGTPSTVVTASHVRVASPFVQ